MNFIDLAYAIQSNPIKNGASLLSITKTGIIVLFDNSQDFEQGLGVLDPLITNRFDDILYYGPIGSIS
jgi:hypothetical protein